VDWRIRAYYKTPCFLIELQVARCGVGIRDRQVGQDTRPSTGDSFISSKRPIQVCRVWTWVSLVDCFRLCESHKVRSIPHQDSVWRCGAHSIVT
jgi:hypothetical protein